MTRLQDLMAELIAAAGAQFAQRFLNGDLADIRRSYAKEDKLADFWYDCKQLQNGLDPAVRELEKMHGMLHRMYLASRQ